MNESAVERLARIQRDDTELLQRTDYVWLLERAEALTVELAICDETLAECRECNKQAQSRIDGLRRQLAALAATREGNDRLFGELASCRQQLADAEWRVSNGIGRITMSETDEQRREAEQASD